MRLSIIAALLLARSAFAATDSWQSLSPGGPAGATLQTFVVDAADLGQLFAGTVEAGLYWSYDDGLSWTAINGNPTPTLAGQTVTSIALDASLSPGCSTPFLFVVAGNSVYASADGGGTWTALYTGGSTPNVVVVDSAGSALYVGTDAGIKRAPLSAASCGVARTLTNVWTDQNTGFTGGDPTPQFSSLILDGTTLIATTYNPGVWTATAGATLTWVEHTDTTDMANDHYGVVMSLGSYGVGFLSPIHGRVATTTNHGATWAALAGTNLPTGIYAVAALGGSLFARAAGQLWVENTGVWSTVNPLLDADTEPVNALASDEGNGVLFSFARDEGLLASIDHGVTFAASDAGIENASVESLAVAANATGGSTVLAASGFGAAFSTDRGQHWTSARAGFATANPHQVTIDPSAATSFWLGSNAGLFHSNNAGPWSLAAPPVQSSYDIVFLSPSLWQATNDNSIFRSIDQGANWQTITTNRYFDSSWLLVDPANPNTFYLQDSGAFSVGQLTANNVSFAAAAGAGLGGPITSLAADFSATPAKFFAATDAAGVFVSADAGASWSPTATLPYPYAYTLSVDPTTHELFGWTRSSVVKSTNAGSCWVDLAADLATADPSGIATDLKVDPVVPESLYLATFAHGVLRMDQAGFATPRLTSITPTSLPVSGGVLTINGANFRAGTTVILGTTHASYNPATIAGDGLSMTVAVPAFNEGVFDIGVSDGVPAQACRLDAAPLLGALTLLGPLPTLSAIAPNKGPPAGGNSVVLTGTNFVAPLTVTIGGALATNVVVASPTEIDALTPPGAAGAADVVVTNPDQQSATLARGYTYVGPVTTPPPGTPGAGTPAVTAKTPTKKACGCHGAPGLSLDGLLALAAVLGRMGLRRRAGWVRRGQG